MYEMKEEYYIGVKEIDEEHTHLFELAEEVYQLMKNDFIPDKYDHIVATIEELRNYTKTHFKHEEEYMEKIQYKRLFTQKIQHQQFADKLDSLNLEEIDENQDAAIQDILDFLTDWLVHHILEVDMLIAEK